MTPDAKIWWSHNYANLPFPSQSSPSKRLADQIMKMMIVDDHAGVRTMIRQLLAAPGDCFVECPTGEAAVQAARDFKPDYITMDIRLPDLSGLEAARAIRDIHPPGRVIIVTSYDQPFLRQSASEVGAVAYILKDNLAELRSLLEGGTIPPYESGAANGDKPKPTPSGEPADSGKPGSPASVPTDPLIDAGQNPAPSRTENPLRVLMIEDSKNDCELIIRHLKRCGFTPRVRRVFDRTEMRRALDQDAWDIIITDNQLPTFSGAEALALVRELGLNIPTLCVTGSADPVRIAEVLNAGACAIVSKDDLAPLCLAVNEALRRKPAQSNPPGPAASADPAAE